MNRVNSPPPTDRAKFAGLTPSKTGNVVFGNWPNTVSESTVSNAEFSEFFRPALSGVWIGGVWNGHFPDSEKYFSEAEFSRKIPEITQKERFWPNFRLRNLKIQGPKKCNSIPPAIPYPH